MNARTKALLAALLVLALTVLALFLVRYLGSGKTLTVKGIGDPGRVTAIIVTSAGKTGEIIRLDDGTWSFSPKGGAAADRARVNELLALFVEDIVSVIPSDPGADLAQFGLDGAGAVSLSLLERGTVLLSLDIGAVQQDADSGPDTFVRVPGQDRVFRVVGADLRRPLHRGIDSLRSSRLFGFAVRDVATVRFASGAAGSASDGVTVRFDGDRKSPLAREMWKIVDPPGWSPGRIEDAVAQAVSITTDGWRDGPPEWFDAGSPAARAVFDLIDGRTVTVTATPARDGFAWASVSDGHGWARIRSDDLALLTKSVFDLADHSLVSIPYEDISSVQIERPSGSLRIMRRGGRCTSPALDAELDRSLTEQWFRSIGEIDASRLLESGGRAPSTLHEVVLTVTSSDGIVQTLALGSADDQGNRVGHSGLFPGPVEVQSAEMAPLFITLDALRVRSVMPGDASALTSITIVSPVFGEAVLTPPPRGEKAWAVRFKDGTVVASEAVTSVAGAAMSLKASEFLSRPAAARVRADHLEVRYSVRDQKAVLKVSAQHGEGSLVAAVHGNRAFAGQSFLISQNAVDSVGAVFALR